MSISFPFISAYVSPQGNDSTGRAILSGSSTPWPAVPTDPIVFRTIDAAYADIRRRAPNYLDSPNRARIFTFALDIPNDIEDVINFNSPYVASGQSYRHISFEVLSQASGGPVISNPNDFNTLIYSSITFDVSFPPVDLIDCQVSNYLIRTRTVGSIIGAINSNLFTNAFVDTRVACDSISTLPGSPSVDNIISIITPRFDRIRKMFITASRFSASILFVIDQKGVSLFDTESTANEIVLRPNSYNLQSFIVSSGNFNLFTSSTSIRNRFTIDTCNIEFFLSDSQRTALLDGVSGSYINRTLNSQLESNIKVQLAQNANSVTKLNSIINFDGINENEIPPINETNVVRKQIITKIEKNISSSDFKNLSLVNRPRLSSHREPDAVPLLNYTDNGNQVRNTRTFYVPKVITNDYVIAPDNTNNVESTVYLIDASNNSINLTLPVNQMDGYYVMIKRIDYSDNIVRIVAPNGTTIEGNRSFRMKSHKCSRKRNEARVLPKKTILFSGNTFYII